MEEATFKAGFHVIATIAAIAEKSSAIVAIIWKPIFSDRSDCSDRCNNDPAEIDLSSLSTIVAIVVIIWKPLSRDCRDLCAEKYTSMQYVAVCSRSSRVFFYSVAIVAIIWKLVVVRIAQLFCSDRHDRSDHMETSI